MKSNAFPQKENQLSIDQTDYWYNREVSSLEAECEWLQDYLLLHAAEETDSFRQQLKARKNRLTNLRRFSNKSFSTSPESLYNKTFLEKELRDFYQDKPSQTHSDLQNLSPRHRFLLEKYDFLTKLDAELKKNRQTQNYLSSQTAEKRNRLRIVFDVGKKFIDILDDIWSVLRNALSVKMFTLLGPFLTGGVGFIINSIEALIGLRQAFLAWRAYCYKDDTLQQKRTRILAGVLTFIFGGVGAGLSIAFIAGAIGAAVSGMTLMPLLIPTFLLSIYTTSLLKRSYIFNRSMAEEKSAKTEFVRLKNEILLHLSQNDVKEFSDLHIKIECSKLKCEYTREERLKAERNVAFNTAEVVATSLVLIGTIIGLSALIGAASFASFGIAPLAILVTGVAIGLFIKAFESIDEKHDFKYTRKLRTFITDCWHKLFPGKNSKKQPAHKESTTCIFETIPPEGPKSNILKVETPSMSKSISDPCTESQKPKSQEISISQNTASFNYKGKPPSPSSAEINQNKPF